MSRYQILYLTYVQFTACPFINQQMFKKEYSNVKNNLSSLVPINIIRRL